ncbi:TRAP transporter substrate-binding protein [Kiloniella laminariae]|uniref:TRAP transporter substrate-binding protein n=1 Tax=Kiloniella laminariae TaxID=454162 RepID=UPI0003A02580|nr:TRAP transporter substrate-binding protein [Kiloniella laminariae]
MRKLSALMAAASVAVMAFAAQAEPIIIKFSHVVQEVGHPKGEAAKQFADRVNSELAGKVLVEVYPNSTLYDDDKALDALELGDLQLAAPSLSKFEKYTKKYRIYDLPFLFDDIAAVDRFQNGEKGIELLGAMEEQGLRGLGYWHNGMKQISANKPLVNPEDAAGLKFRVQTSDVLVAIFQELEANPQKMAFSEVYGALQQGVVDGQENTWSNIYTKKFYEVQDGTTESNHGVLDYLLVTSTDFWDNLPEDIRADLERILGEVTQEANATSTAVNEESKEKIIAAGGVVRTLTAEQKAAWRARLSPVWKQFTDDIGQDLIDAALASNQ